jgi:hypothetical protein
MRKKGRVREIEKDLVGEDIEKEKVYMYMSERW